MCLRVPFLIRMDVKDFYVVGKAHVLAERVAKLFADDPVLQRADDSSNPDDDKWKKDNPLETQDDGADDETVLFMIDGTIRRF